MIILQIRPNYSGAESLQKATAFLDKIFHRLQTEAITEVHTVSVEAQELCKTRITHIRHVLVWMAEWINMLPAAKEWNTHILACMHKLKTENQHEVVKNILISLYKNSKSLIWTCKYEVQMCIFFFLSSDTFRFYNVYLKLTCQTKKECVLILMFYK